MCAQCSFLASPRCAPAWSIGQWGTAATAAAFLACCTGRVMRFARHSWRGRARCSIEGQAGNHSLGCVPGLHKRGGQAAVGRRPLHVAVSMWHVYRLSSCANVHMHGKPAAHTLHSRSRGCKYLCIYAYLRTYLRTAGARSSGCGAIRRYVPHSTASRSVDGLPNQIKEIHACTPVARGFSQ